LTTELVKVTSAGDRWMGDLAKLGRKGAFIKEIDRALLDDQADLAVHCLKDIPGDIPVADGLAFAGYLPREDIHDAVISRSGARLAELLGDRHQLCAAHRAIAAALPASADRTVARQRQHEVDAPR
jgi:porphobilinogen deaminase